jgi:hypothetical protein
MATTWQALYLLTKFNQLAARPASGDAITDAAKYQRLTDAQNSVIADIAARFPNSLFFKSAYGSLPTLTTTDNQVYTFGTDTNGDPVYPYGKAVIFPSLASYPDSPWTEGFDYLSEGNQIRIPNNSTHSGTLYWQGIETPHDIDATHDPALLPPQSRVLIAIKATISFAKEGNRNAELAATMQAEYGSGPSLGGGEFAKWAMVWRTQFRSGGALAPLVSSFAGNASWVGGYGSLGG